MVTHPEMKTVINSQFQWRNINRFTNKQLQKIPWQEEVLWPFNKLTQSQAQTLLSAYKYEFVSSSYFAKTIKDYAKYYPQWHELTVWVCDNYEEIYALCKFPYSLLFGEAATVLIKARAIRKDTKI